MIHKYKLGDYNIVLDVNSGGVHVVDELTYDMLDNVAPPFAPECPEEVVTKLSRFYDPEEVRSCYAEILEAYQEGILFSLTTAICVASTASPLPAISARAES